MSQTASPATTATLAQAAGLTSGNRQARKVRPAITNTTTATFSPLIPCPPTRMPLHTKLTYFALSSHTCYHGHNRKSCSVDLPAARCTQFFVHSRKGVCDEGHVDERQVTPHRPLGVRGAAGYTGQLRTKFPEVLKVGDLRLLPLVSARELVYRWLREELETGALVSSPVSLRTYLLSWFNVQGCRPASIEITHQPEQGYKRLPR